MPTLDRMSESAEINRSKGNDAKDARASSSYVDAAMMRKMRDGAVRPINDLELTTDCYRQTIVGIPVSKS